MISILVQILYFQKLRDAEKERVKKQEELENKANVQLERQLVMASEWSRKLLTLRGKLKGTEWDPENSHKIDYSEFLRLLNSKNVKYMEYSNFGQTVSGRKMFLIVFLCNLMPFLFFHSPSSHFTLIILFYVISL